MLHGYRDNHGRELRALRLVDSHRVRQRDLVQFPVVVDNQPFVEPYRDFLLHGVDPLDHAYVAVEDLLFVVVLSLDDLVADLDRSPVHWAQNLNVTDWVEPISPWCKSWSVEHLVFGIHRDSL